MKLIKTLVILLLLHSATLANAQIIKWSKDRPLTWADFQGPPDKSSPYDASTSFYTGYSFYCKHVDSLYIINFKLNGGFDTQRAWSVKRMTNEDVLKHEQLHFDIHEVYMRKLFAAFNAAKYTANYREEIKNIYNQVMDRLRAAQIKYDTDAGHSVNIDMQHYWETYIHRQLDAIPADY
jgi:hypothetical protein